VTAGGTRNILDCGIYVITSPSGEQYVGQSARIKRRWSEHLYLLLRGTHYNPLLQNAWTKYGDAMLFVKVKLCPARSLTKWEQHYIDTLKPKYNLSPTANSPLGVKRSAAFKAAISAAHLGRVCTEEKKEKIRKTLTGVSFTSERRAAIRKGMKIQLRAVRCIETGETFPCINEAARIKGPSSSRTKCPGSNISKVCTGERETAYGYKWEYV